MTSVIATHVMPNIKVRQYNNKESAGILQQMLEYLWTMTDIEPNDKAVQVKLDWTYPTETIT